MPWRHVTMFTQWLWVANWRSGGRAQIFIPDGTASGSRGRHHQLSCGNCVLFFAVESVKPIHSAAILNFYRSIPFFVVVLRNHSSLGIKWIMFYSYCICIDFNKIGDSHLWCYTRSGDWKVRNGFSDIMILFETTRWRAILWLKYSNIIISIKLVFIGFESMLNRDYYSGGMSI